MRYQLDDRPPWPAMLLYGLQWSVMTLPCVVVVGVVAAGLHGYGHAESVLYLRKLMALNGLAMMAQILAGHRLPLVIGPAAVLTVGVAAATGAGHGALYTAMAAGGALTAALGFANLLAPLRRLFTTRVVAVILILIAFTLSPVILGLITGGASPGPSLAMGLGLILGLAVINEILTGALKSLTMPLGLAVGTLLHRLLAGAAGAAAPQGASAPAVRAWLVEPSLDPGVMLAFALCFLALIINALGSVEAVGHLTGAPGMDRRIRRGLGVIGLANSACGLFGVVGPVDYSMSAGLIAATGCAARRTFLPAALGLLACAASPTLVAALAAIPGPVMGAVLLYSLVSQLSGGLGLLVRERAVAGYADGVIVGLPLMAGLMVAFCPPHAFAGLPALWRPIAANGFVMGTLAGLLLEHVVFRNRAVQAGEPK